MNRVKATVVAAAIILTLGSLIPSVAPPVQAHEVCNRVLCFTFPCYTLNCNTWAPDGPQINRIQFQYYTDDTSEFNAFFNGQLDLIDTGLFQTGVPPPLATSWSSITDFNLSPPTATSTFYGIDFNYASSTWASWGCDFQHGNSLCGVEIREAFAHLIDKSSFIANSPLQGVSGANPVADDLPGTMLTDNGTAVASSASTQCQWDTIPAHRSPCISAFHIASEPGGFAQPGSPDFCAAVDHLIQATVYAPGLGLRRDPSNSCAIDPASPGLANIVAHPMRVIARTTDPTRLQLSHMFATTINQLFAGQPVNLFLRSWPGILSTCNPIIFSMDCWDWYTFGYRDSNPFPMDGLYSTYDSHFAAPVCGSISSCVFTSNPTSVEIPSLDTALEASVSTGDANTAFNDVFSALNIMGSHAQDIPVYNPTGRTVALYAVADPVNQLGVGFSNSWTYLSASKLAPFQPQNSMYQFDGGGAPSTIRSGQAGGEIISTVNPYNAQWIWEFNLINEVYDSLFVLNPTVPAQAFCWMCDTYSQSVDSSGNTHFLVELRQSIRWQDGVPVDAKDVKFSLLTLRDLSTVAGGGLSSLLDVKVLGNNLLDIVMQGQSLNNLAGLASAPIIPRHIWELPGDHTYGDVGTVDPAKLDFSYDPIASGTFIGSGPFMCSSVFSGDLGQVGTGCSVNPDGTRGGSQVLCSTICGTITLSRYDRTSEAGNTDPFLQWFRNYNANWGMGSGTAAFSGQFQEFSWADRFDNAQVTTQDLASVAACYGKSSPSGCADYSYWLESGFHPGTPNTISTEVTVVASHLDDSWVYPFSWNGNQTIQPGPQIVNIVPYNS